jgi:hypothetical protein
MWMDLTATGPSAPHPSSLPSPSSRRRGALPLPPAVLLLSPLLLVWPFLQPKLIGCYALCWCRRTGQLNHAAQNANRKRATPSDCAREMIGEKGRAMKQPRVVA